MATRVSRLQRRLAHTGRGEVIGGIVLGILGTIHLFVVQLGNLLGFALLLVVWPLIGGIVGSRFEAYRRGDDASSPITGLLAGVYGAIVVTLLVFLTGLAGSWSQFITTSFGVSLWPVVFAVLVTLTISWTVSGYVGGYLDRTFGDRLDTR